MHPFFEPLNDREAMLLLTTMTVGGSDETQLFRFLPPDSAGRLAEKAAALQEIPSDKRVAFMVKQIKQAMSFKGLRGVEKVDPSWILQAMKGESPRTVAAILISLPPQTVRSILKRLPSGIRKRLPPKEEMKSVPVELVRAVRQIFESRFHAMPQTTGNTFSFQDVVHLDRKDLYHLMRDLGLAELGQAFVAVGKMALAELCRRLPRAKAEELILAVRNASKVDPPDLKSAQRFLSKVVVNFKDTEEFFHNAGLWRIAKASLPEGDDFKLAFRQRLPRQAGELFDGFMQKASEMEEFSDDVLRRVQDTVLVRVQALAQNGVLESRWGQAQMAFNDPDFAASMAQGDEEAAAHAEGVDSPEDFPPESGPESV